MVKQTFRPGEPVVIYGLIVNSIRQTIKGEFIREIITGDRAGHYLIRIGQLAIAVDPRKVRKDG